MSVQYSVDIAEFQTKPPVNAFDLSTKTVFYGRNQSHIQYTSCQRYEQKLFYWCIYKFIPFRWNNLNESIRSGMAVLDVTIPTGYWIQQQKLDAYVISKRVRNLQRAKFNDKKVLFYFDYVSSHQDSTFLFIFIFEFNGTEINSKIITSFGFYHYFSWTKKKPVLTLP